MKNIVRLRENSVMGYYIEIQTLHASIRQDDRICEYLNIDIDFYFSHGKNFNG